MTLRHLVTVTAVVTAFIVGTQGALHAQEAPRNEYLRYVPLQYPSMVTQTRASAAFNLYGDVTDPSYRDSAPVDGIDDRRGQVLLDLSVRFAPYLVQNTTLVPMDFRRFMNRGQSFPLFVDTWEISGSTPQLIASDDIEWTSLATNPCSPVQPRPLAGNADCRLVALLDAFDPLAPGPTRSVKPDSTRFTVMFYDFPAEDPETWRREYVDQVSGHLPRAYADFAGINAHPFVVENRGNDGGEIGYEFVIQYWFFYPFNDGGNNHEGDWEHINVLITPLDKIGEWMTADDIRRILNGGGLSDDAADRLVIKRVDYYFHEKVFTLDYTRPNVYATRDAWQRDVASTVQERLSEAWYWKRIRYHAYWDDAETVINTHPIAFIGADNKGTDQLLSSAGGATNRDSHGTFPFPALYKDVGPAGAAEQLTQRFDHRAYYAKGGDARVESIPPFRRGHAASFAHADKILIIPDGERVVNLVKVSPQARRDWAWLVLPIRWGYPAVQSPFAGVVAHAETGNLSPVGPSYNSGWNRIGDARGYEAYVPHKFSPLVPNSWQDGFINSWGWLNLTFPTLAALPPFDLLNRFVIQPVRALMGAGTPILIPSEDIPYRFVGVGGGVSYMTLDIDFVDLLVNEDQIDNILQSLTDFSMAIGDTVIGGSEDFVQNASTGYAEINLYLGRRFAGESTLRHGFTNLGVTVSFPTSGEVWELRGRLNFWEYAGSLRYDFSTGRLRPSLKVGYGLSWYRVENVTTNGELLETPNGPWVRKPTISDLSTLLPNTWHIGTGLEWVPLRSYAPIPRGMDLSIRGDIVLYVHRFGGQIPFGPRSVPAPGVLGEIYQNPIITRPVFNLSAMIGF